MTLSAGEEVIESGRPIKKIIFQGGKINLDFRTTGLVSDFAFEVIVLLSDANGSLLICYV